MSPRSRLSRARRGFTLIELLVVITIILLISALFLNISSGDGGGLMGGQRMVGSTIRSVRAMALMNRGAQGTGVSYNARYRLLILNDPTDPVNHLHKYMIAVGSVDTSTLAAGVDPTTVTSTSDTRYKWYTPDAPTLLPSGVYFVPPASDTSNVVNKPPGFTGTWIGRASIIGQIADNATANSNDNPGSPPWMMFASQGVIAPTSLGAMSGLDAKKWYYVELQTGGTSNHLGRVVLVLANGALRLDPASNKVQLDLANENQFAALSLRPSGDVAMTTDPDELNTNLLK
ncbi:MAG: prepilin-type N-terminal cleavage/methylation domain-containing protein [Verrucomicrobia bacterium]|nr:prepilin-type N-terminal cleavage/methylation domain-containing protein [Verrucomicrobiota bacterium]